MKTYQNLLVAVAGRDGACVFEQAIAQRALSMVDVRDDAEVSVPLNWDGRNARLELRRRWLGGICTASCKSRGKGEESGAAQAARPLSKSRLQETLARPSSANVPGQAH